MKGRGDLGGYGWFAVTRDQPFRHLGVGWISTYSLKAPSTDNACKINHSYSPKDVLHESFLRVGATIVDGIMKSPGLSRSVGLHLT